ncbi:MULTISPECIES: dihydrofolate reductase [unclassified Arthrobacter]|uniref:dihydrofolate reductase n=1 Tax=unclassified Arthrobacter TaxID=235627 RepID=UPI002DF8EA00|nr:MULTISPECIES: dihydrofolate reductase [unclassified Arthrobacter]MEC5190080.1 dihydrofolate reductase [Arthrobacter sp. MP_M4]MEC5201548.1 dihydrofolate reductase [Arthrobacter sp. MP_M7]
MSDDTMPGEQPADFPDKLAALAGLGMVWAQTSTGVIGKDGGMPWHLPEDMAHFARLTTGHPVIMGRKTWESFPDKYRPLPGRTNIVITGQETWGATPAAAGSTAVRSLDDALLESQFAPGNEMVWIIGGGKIFAQSMDLADVAVITTIDTATEGDTFAPDLDYDWTLEGSLPVDGWETAGNGTRYRISVWRRREH